MRKYLLPALVCAAIGAVIILLVKSGEEPPTGDRKTVVEAPQPVTQKESPLGTPAETTTRLDEHRWLRELERALARGDIGKAHVYRQRVCEDMDNILASEMLTKNLLDDIRKYGIESDDLATRDVVLPMLRVIQNPEATQMIADEYYRARNEAEAMMFLEAMAHEYHDPKQAAVWAIDRALNSESAEYRERAFDLIQDFAADDDLICDTALQIYESTTRPEQKHQALEAVAMRGDLSPVALRFMRGVLRNPRPEELAAVIGTVENWGDENDAARLEALAEEFPAMGDILRDRAKGLRRVLKMRRGEPQEPEPDPEPEPESEKDKEPEPVPGSD